MATKNEKCYETPNGLQEDDYYEMIHNLMNYINKKGLTVRQAQKLFTDCANMVLDTKITSNNNESDDTRSDTDRICSELDQIRQSLDYLPDRLYVSNKLS